MVLEISRFKLVPGTDERAFLDAAEQTQSGFLAKQEGFISRELLRAEDGWWMDIVRFESVSAAQAAFQGFAQNPSAKDFEMMLDTSTAEISHWSLAKSW